MIEPRILSLEELVVEHQPPSEMEMETTNKIYPQITMDQPASSQARMIIGDLVASETLYLEKLNLLRYVYMGVLEKLLPSDKFNELQTYVELADIHTIFLDEIKDYNRDDCVEYVCNVVLRYRTQHMHLYAKMARNREAVISLMENTSEKKAIDRALQEACDPEDLEFWPVVLFEPRRRLVYYGAVFRQLARELSSTDSNKKLVDRCDQLLNSSIDTMDSIYQLTENQSITRNIMGKIENLKIPEEKVLTDYGLHLLEGKCKLIEAKKKQKCYVYLFQQLVIFAEVNKKGAMKHHRVAVLSHFDITIELKRFFHFKAKEFSNEKDFTFKIKCPAEATIWGAAVREIIDTLNLLKIADNDHQYAMIMFDGLKICDACTDFVGGSNCFRCEKCEIVVHKTCFPTAGLCKSEIASRISRQMYPKLN